MKFTFQNVVSSIFSCKMRIGKLSEIERLPGAVFETPLLLLHTRGGSIPHITREVFQLLTNQQHVLHIPLANSLQCYSGLKGTNMSISDFISLKENLIYCSLHDSSEPTPQGYNDRNTITVWSHTGRKQLTPESYMSIVEAFRPDIYETLCDGDTNAQSTKKRSFKAVETTSTMFEKCMIRHENSSMLKHSAVFGVVEGGYYKQAREVSIKQMIPTNVDGFVIDGLHNNGPAVGSVSYENVEDILTEILKLLPADKPRVLHGGWRPDVVLHLISAGVDIFDSSIVYVTTEKGCAFTFGYKTKSKNSDAVMNKEEACFETNDIPGREQIEAQKKKLEFDICIKDSKFFDDFKAISSSCSCLTCKNHTRSYIHHLLNTKELLGPLLLMMCTPYGVMYQCATYSYAVVASTIMTSLCHNLHHYMEFFKFIRESGKNGQFVEVLTLPES